MWHRGTKTLVKEAKVWAAKGREFEKSRKNECPDRDEENQESVGETSTKENVIDCGQCF